MKIKNIHFFQQKGAEYDCNGKLDNFRLEFANYSERWQGALATIKEAEGKEVFSDKIKCS